MNQLGRPNGCEIWLGHSQSLRNANPMEQSLASRAELGRVSREEMVKPSKFRISIHALLTYIHTACWLKMLLYILVLVLISPNILISLAEFGVFVPSTKKHNNIIDKMLQDIETVYKSSILTFHTRLCKACKARFTL